MSRWYVVLTNVKCEEKAGRNLRRAGFSAYAPMGRVEKFSKRKKIWRETEFRIFPRYLFVEVDGPVAWYRLRACEGVERVLGAEGRPQALNQVETNALLAVRDAEQNFAFDDTRAGKLHRKEIGRTKKETTKLRFPVGSHVLAKRGPFTGFPAEVINVSGRGTISAVLNVFGRLSPVEFPPDWVEELDEVAEAA